MKKLLLLFLLLSSLPLLAQNVTVNAQLVDSDNQQWAYAQYQVQLVLPTGYIGTPLLRSTGKPFQMNYYGSADSTGSFMVSLPPNGMINPSGTQWKFTITPDVTAVPSNSVALTILGAGSISSQLNAVIKAPRVTGGPGINAYNDLEVAAFAPNQYFNVISQTSRCYTTLWGPCNGGGGSNPGGSNTDVQFNNNSQFGGDDTFNFNSTTKAVSATQYYFGNVASGRYGLLSLTDQLGSYTSIQLYDTCSGCGTTIDSHGVYAASFQTGGGTTTGALLVSGTTSLGQLGNTVPGQGIEVDLFGGGTYALNVMAGVAATNFNSLVLSGNTTNNSVFLGNADGGETHSEFVGVGAGSAVSGATNQIAIGYGAQATLSNQTVIGNSLTTALLMYGTPTFPALAGAGGCAGLTSGGQLFISSGGCGGGSGGAVLLSPGAGVSQTVTQQSGTALNVNVLTAGTFTVTGLTASTSTVCPNGSGGAFTTTGCATGNSGLTSGYIPLAGSATTLTGNSHLDDGHTTSGTITSTEPVVVPSITSASLALKGSTSGVTTVTVPATGTSYTLDIPSVQPTPGSTFVSCTPANPSVCSFANPGGTPGGSAGQMQYYSNASAVFAGSPGVTVDSSGNVIQVHGKTVAGISFTNTYSGATFADRINQCMADAAALTNSNTSYVCSARNETGAQSTTTNVVWGNSAGITVGLELPCNAVWTWTGSGVGFTQYGGSAVYDLCPSAGISNAMNMAVGSGSTLTYLYETLTSSQPYITFSGFVIKNTTGTTPTTSGVLFYLQGPLNDGSTGSNTITYDTTDTYNVKVYNVSSAFTWMNSEFNAGNHGTPLFLFTDASGYEQSDLWLSDTFVHPGTGNYAVYALDTRTSPTNKISGATFINPYTETNPDGVTYTYNFSGWGKAAIEHATIKCYATSPPCTAPMAHVSNAYDTALLIDDVWFGRGSGDYTLPATVVVNDYDSVASGVVVTDSNGHFDHYAPKSLPAWFGPLTAASLTTNGTGPGSIVLSPYSASGTALPACSSGNVNTEAMVSDATSPTYLGTYTSGGTVSAPVYCQNSGGTYAWKTY